MQMTNSFWVFVEVIGVVSIIAFAVPSCAEEKNTDKWEPMDMAAVRNILDGTASEREKAKALVQILDTRISFSRHVSSTKLNPNPASEYASLIRLLGTPVWQPESEQMENRRKDRIRALEELISKVRVIPLNNGQHVEAYLHIAAALAGAAGYGDTIAALLDGPDCPKEVLALALEALKVECPITALPSLLRLTKHPWAYVYTEDVGPQRPERIFPIRLGAYACLQRLGIQCKVTKVKDDTPDPMWNVVLDTTVVEIDREALQEKLRSMLLSDDQWKIARDSIRDDGRQDMHQLLVSIMQSETFPADKTRELEALARELATHKNSRRDTQP